VFTTVFFILLVMERPRLRFASSSAFRLRFDAAAALRTFWIVAGLSFVLFLGDFRFRSENIVMLLVRTIFS
jgi:hypothetical protein